MTTGIGPYVVPAPIDTDPTANVVETTFVAAHTMVDIGGGVMAHAETLNGAIPGPTLRLNVGDTVIVRLINELDHPTGIHWHGIELANSADGTEVTQEAVIPAFPPPPPPAPAGGTYLYKFKVPRPGLYWYHPHHHMSTNRVFRGQYGMIVVTDPNEAALVGSVLPAAADTRQLVLSDITVCKAPGANDAATYVDPTTIPVAADRPEWLSAATSQPSPTPVTLCEIMPAGDARDDMGMAAMAPYAAGEVPSLIRTGRTNEGQTVLTNGVNVGGRAGTPLAPQALAPGAQKLSVLAGQGLRLQIVNSATTRYFRLILTTSTGTKVDLVRVGGEGGLLDSAVVEGGVIGTLDTHYTSGEILLPPGSRADVVAAIPPGAPLNSVLTLWTRDFQRTGAGAGWSNLPTVPVMHLEVTGTAGATYTLAAGTPLASTGTPVPVLGMPNGTFLVPATFSPAKFGMPVTGMPTTQNIRFTTSPLGVNGIPGSFEGFTPYSSAPHIDSSRYAEAGRTLELVIENTSPAHHPFHLHGFSFQPISLTPGSGAPMGSGSFTWPYHEFRDNLDIPGNYNLTFRVRLDDRPLLDGTTMGGWFGRWLFHCHIFFHHHQGMIGEFVVTAADGSEKPDVDVAGTWVYAPIGGSAARHGTFRHPDGDLMTLTATKGTVLPAGPAPGGAWSWSYNSMPGDPPSVDYVYITATDPGGRQDQAVFRLKVGGGDDGADNGDPHIRTVDGKRYDFQGAGEFVLLRDHEGLEIQARQTPVMAANPITDDYSGLTVCVSLNTAVAARVGSHRIAYQPGPERGQLQFYLDGKPARLTPEGIDLEGHRVSAYDAGDAAGLRVDYENLTVLTVTPNFWSSHGLWYLNISVAHTQAEWGIMGSIPESTWLPRLPNGATVGPMPASLGERYDTLYRTFADAWRVTDDTSLFVYAAGTSTDTFTDLDWPSDKPPCRLKPRFEIPGAPIPVGIEIDRAREICRDVTVDHLNRDCVFDVATTGDETFAKGYLRAQELWLRGSTVQITGDRGSTATGEPLEVTATVLPMHGGKEPPAGSVTFLVDGAAAGPPVKLDGHGRARFTADRLDVGTHRIRAAYAPEDGDRGYLASSSANLLHTVREGPEREGSGTSGGPSSGPPTGTPTGTPSGTPSGSRTMWMWIILILILLIILILVIASRR
ncbi:MAG TPA: multicopper oxidase domain-containing protein [Longimicrobium sp.]|nr:multicopper oxidase domain-containing protein [Longimicrobium sp.]